MLEQDAQAVNKQAGHLRCLLEEHEQRKKQMQETGSEFPYKAYSVL